MAISEAFAGSASIGTTEWSLPAGSAAPSAQTDDGVYQLVVEMNDLVAGDRVRLKFYEKTQAGSTQRVIFTVTFSGDQVQPLWASPSLILLHGWDMTMQKISGTDRTIAWSIRKVA